MQITSSAVVMPRPALAPDGDVRTPGCIVSEREKTVGCVVVARCVTTKCPYTVGCVFGAAEIVMERALTVGGVAISGCVTVQRRDAVAVFQEPVSKKSAA